MLRLTPACLLQPWSLTASLTCGMVHALQINVKQGKTVRFMQLAMGTENDMVRNEAVAR
jgi:hypothetical protein